MPLPCPGPASISLANIQTEFGGSNPISINEYYANGLYVPSATGTVPTSGQIRFSDFFCAVNEIVIYITQNTENVNVQSLFSTYWTQNIRKRLVINPGVVVGSRYTSQYALDIPTGGASTVTIENRGSIQGAGGYPDLIRANFYVTKEGSANDSITFTGPNSFTFYDSNQGSQDQLIYTNTNYALSGSTDQCGWSLRIIAPNAVGLDDSQGCSPDGDYNDIVVYISVGYFFESGGTIYYRVNSPYGNGPTGGSAIAANSGGSSVTDIRINNLGSIYAGGGAGGRGGDGGNGYYNQSYDCSYNQPVIVGSGYGGGNCDQSCGYEYGYSCISGCNAYESGGDGGGYFYVCDGCGYYEYVSQTCYNTIGTYGGAGGPGGQGQGYAQDLTDGVDGFPGGPNAGAGGRGRGGGSFGDQGVTGNPGGNGNDGQGGAGRSGGLAGCYITNNQTVTWIANGDRRGRIC